MRSQQIIQLGTTTGSATQDPAFIDYVCNKKADPLRHHVPDLKIRVVNTADLMTLQPHEEHPHGITGHDFDALFTTDKPVIFAHHGYPWLIHRLTYRRINHHNIPLGRRSDLCRQIACRCGLACQLYRRALLGANPLLHDLVDEFFAVQDGKIEIPDRPGLGITAREDFLAAHIVK